MKLIITENQLKDIINILSEKYVEDPYYVDNDIYDYNPSQNEIDDFNKIDIPSYHDFKGFGEFKMDDRYGPNKKFIKPIKFKREKKPSGKNYTGRAMIVYTYPGGMEVKVKNSEGPIAVVVDKLKKIKQLNKNDAPFYSIKYEVVDGKNKIFEDIHPSEAYDDIDSLMTVIDGRRPLCFVNFINQYETDRMIKLIGVNKLKLLKVESNKYNGYIVYRDGYLDNANELKSIMDKNNGYLVSTGDYNTIYRIGKLLGYYEDDIIQFIKQKKQKKQ